MKDIKRRIKSVESTKQITNAMQLVASSKLRKAKEKADNARPFFNALYDTMCEIQSENQNFFSAFTAKKTEVKTTLLIVIAGDRGLAGGFNGNILKLAQARIDEIKATSSVRILAIGKKSYEYFTKRGYDVIDSYINIGESMKIHIASGISDKIITPYKNGEFDSVELFHTEYVSPLVQTASSRKIFPIDVEVTAKEGTFKELPIYEPSAEDVFNSIVPKYITGIIFGAVVDSFASEQAARRIAMESATDNADEMISGLSLIYNRARQASITQEITEIVSGSSAQE